MRTRLQLIGAAAVSLVVCGACCCGGGGGTYIVSTPSPPSAALVDWQDFPANRVPRPIVLQGRYVDRVAEFTGPASVAIACHKFTLGSGVSQSIPRQATVTWTDGIRVTYPAMSARATFAAFNPTPASGVGDCAGIAPLVVTAARLATDTFLTDHGPAQMSAWLFSLAAGFRNPVMWSYPAVATSSIWRGGRTIGYSYEAAMASGDGLSITVLLYGFPAGDGRCDASYRGVAAESESAVEVDLQTVRSPAYGCVLTTAEPSVSVPLIGPLGGRVVMDTSGNVITVCPANPKPGSPPCYFLPPHG